jgi:gamma-glutamylcyclotransferase (GGCT)/AIG2-like uncharacterized protein YtfP
MLRRCAASGEVGQVRNAQRRLKSCLTFRRLTLEASRMQPTPVRHVFVYGTLRRGEVRDINRLRPAPRWLGTARVPGVLYHLGAYPGVVLGAPGWVCGEVYAISAQLERQLDEIEEVWPQQSGEYCKQERMVRLDQTAEEVMCILYEIAPERITGMPVIAGGDWVQRRPDENS